MSAIALRDDFDRPVVLGRFARRIVSLVPSLTETLFALGAGNRVVGITKFCVEPANASQGAALIGGCKNPEIDAIVALSPDLVLVNAEENRREDFDRLIAAGLTVFVTYPRTVADVPNLLEHLGRLSGCDQAADTMAAELRAVLRSPIPAVRIRVFCPIWKNPWMGFNADSYAHDMLLQAGGNNILQAREDRYCGCELGEIAAMDPELLLLPSEPYIFRDKDLAEMTELQTTRAWRTRQIRFIDGKDLLWYGVRTAPGLIRLRSLIASVSKT